MLALESSGLNSSPREGNGEERERFWIDMDRLLDRVGNGCRLCILGDLNGWIGDGMKPSITGAFGLPGENDNDGRVVFYTERGLCVGNTYLNTGVCISTQGWQGSRWSEDKEHDRSGAGEEEYAVLCARCEGSERNGSRPHRSPCGTM